MIGHIFQHLSQLTLDQQEACLARIFDKEDDLNVRLVLRRSVYRLPTWLIARLTEEAFISVLNGDSFFQNDSWYELQSIHISNTYIGTATRRDDGSMRTVCGAYISLLKRSPMMHPQAVRAIFRKWNSRKWYTDPSYKECFFWINLFLCISNNAQPPDVCCSLIYFWIDFDVN